MPDYDFRSLNHHEFQILNNDLFSAEFNIHVERFKSGKDRGIDGRFFEYENRTCIIQSKHYVESGKQVLIRDLEKEELPKLHKIKPDRYLIATSVPLLENDKTVIKKKLNPYVLSTSDIYGKDDINALLAKYEHIERNHYKLWIASSTVLSRFINAAIYNAADELIADALRGSSDYVKTAHHNSAKKLLDDKGVIVVTGEPGVGKTTLAKQLCLQYVHDGYSLVVISEDIKEALSVFNKEFEQIFYYDDFLGSNYLEAITGNKDSRIMQFIDTVRNSPKSKFILTSRTNVLDQGYRLSQVFFPKKLAPNEYTLNIDSLSDYDKGLILYSFMWKSNISRVFFEEFIAKERYLAVIKHRNYNPRLVEAITNESLVDSQSPEEYFQYIDNALNNPAFVWGHAYDVQSDEISRRIIDLISLSDGGIKEDCLIEAIARYRNGNPIPISSNISQDFYETVAPLCRTFINRNRAPIDGFESAVLMSGLSINKGEVWYTPFNPSITDFVLSRYKRDPTSWARMVFYYPTNEGLQRIKSLLYWSKDIGIKVLDEVFRTAIQNVQSIHPLFLATLYAILDEDKKAQLAEVVSLHTLYRSVESASISKEDCSDLVRLCCASITDETDSLQVIDFLKDIIKKEFNYYALELISNICISLCTEDNPYENELKEIQKTFLERLNECWHEELIDDFLSDNLEKAVKYYTDEDGGSDYEIDEYALTCMMVDYSGELFANIDMTDAQYILETKDLHELIKDQFRDNDKDRSGDGASSDCHRDGLSSLFEGFIGAKYGKNG